MPIKRTTDQANRLTTLTAPGKITPEEVKKAVEAFIDDPPAKNILWDFREAIPSASFNADRTMEVASLSKSVIGARYDGKTAFVVSSELTFGMCNTYMSQLQQRGAFHRTKVFYDMDEARKWLEEEN